MSVFKTNTITCPKCQVKNIGVNGLFEVDCYSCNTMIYPELPPAPATPMRTSTFNTILDEMRSVHDKKSADYANPQDRFSNFVEAACEAGCSVDTVFRVLIGIKNARIKQLMNSGTAPKNESLKDSILDRTVYSVLWMAWRREHGT